MDVARLASIGKAKMARQNVMTIKGISCVLALAMLAACSADETKDSGSPTRDQATPENDPEIVGRRAFSACAVCHSVKQDGGHRVGPNLFGVYGRKAGIADGFAYSSGLRTSGVVWTDETLNAYLENPQDFIRGNRMSFAGESDPQTRRAIIAYLKTLQPAQ